MITRLEVPTVCSHEWVKLHGDMDYCKKCQFLGSKHLTAVVGAVVDTVRLMFTLGNGRKVPGKELIESFAPGKQGWLVCRVFHQDSLVLSWLGRKKVLIGIDEALAAGIVVRCRGERGQFLYSPGQPNDLQAHKLMAVWRKHQPLLEETDGTL